MAAQRHAPLQTLSLISECYQGKSRPYQPGDWWSQTGSNRRPQACKASALPTELWPRPSGLWSSLELVGLSGLEPLTSRLSGVCSNHLSYRPLTVRRPSGRRSGAYAPPRRSSRGLRPDDRCAQGHTDRAELTEHSGKKEKRSRRQGQRTSGYHERHHRCSRDCWSMCSNIEP